MRILAPIFTFALVGAGMWGNQEPKVTVIISGGARGHLSPCGCTKPMSGGLKRLATLIREYKAKGDTIWIDSGDITIEPGRQSQLKAETYSDIMGNLGVDVAAFTTNDQKQGVGLVAAGSALSKTKWLTAIPGPTNFTEQSQSVRGISVSLTNSLAQSAGLEQSTDILLFDGSRSQISDTKIDHQLIVTSTDGIPTVDGKIVSPGSNLRGVVVATFQGSTLLEARVELLPASVKEDKKADAIYRNYLSRVAEEGLINKVIKETNDPFVGSVNCKSCHGKVYSDYAKTKHAHAYQSLITDGHQADPDCVSCHVVGLNSTKGFEFGKTPRLAQVGCESCHGAGQDHARQPKKFRLPKVQESKCITCHTPSNSPTFQFKEYWKKIKH